MCPPVVTPGDFFVCTADIPRGSDVQFSLVMTDDLDTTMKTDTGLLEAPKQWLRIPGRPLKTASWNTTLTEMTTSRIIKTSYFKYLSNLTAIEYIPMSSGDLYVDVSLTEPRMTLLPAYLDNNSRLSTEEGFWGQAGGHLLVSSYRSLRAVLLLLSAEPRWLVRWLAMMMTGVM